MRTALILLLVLSLALNAFLWSRLTQPRVRADIVDDITTESVAKGEAPEHPSPVPVAATPTAAENGERELLRLRNEVSQLRTQLGEAAQWRTQALIAEGLRRHLMVATQELAHTEEAFRNLAKLSPTEMQEMKDEAHAVRCVNNLKQLALAARIWANDHNDTFPPDYLSMQAEIASPKILFCPGDPNATPVNDWSAVGPSAPTYRYLNPGGTDLEPEKQLLSCPIHGHIALSDGSVQRR